MAKSKPVTQALENSVAASPKQEDPVDNYETQGHLRTLTEAHGIMNDPEKMAKVHKLAGRHGKAIAAIKDVPTPDEGFKSLDDVKKYTQDTYGGAGAPKKKAPKLSLKDLQAKDTDKDGV